MDYHSLPEVTLEIYLLPVTVAQIITEVQRNVYAWILPSIECTVIDVM